MPAFPDRDRGYRRPAVGMAPDGGGYPFEIPYGPSGTGYDNTLGGGDGFGGYGPQRPYETRCDNTDTFKQVAAKRKMRKQYIRRVINAPSLGICQQECAGARDFMCSCQRFPSQNDLGSDDYTKAIHSIEIFRCP